MSVRTTFVLLIALCFSCGCEPVSPSNTLPSPTTSPSPTAVLPVPTTLLPTPTNDRVAPNNVPACKDARYAEQPVKFVWSGIEDIIRDAPETNWTYYHCPQSRATLASSYREWMVKSPYNWIETHWEERAEATMGVYYGNSGSSSIPNRWLYLWFLPESSAGSSSSLVAAWWNIPPSC